MLHAAAAALPPSQLPIADCTLLPLPLPAADGACCGRRSCSCSSCRCSGEELMAPLLPLLQVEKLMVLEAAGIDLLARKDGGPLPRQAADGFA